MMAAPLIEYSEFEFEPMQILHHGDQSGQGGAALVRMATLESAAQCVAQLAGKRVPGGVTPLVVR